MTALPRRLLPDTAAVGDDGWLTVGGCSIRDLAAEFGTPFFVYDEEHLRSRCREAVAAFGPEQAIYATKAFLCRAMARLAHEEHLRLDVATGGELHTVLRAGVPADACVMHGNNKSVAELQMGIDEGVRHIVVDSFDELDRLDALAADRAGPAPDVMLRVTPGVHAHTHEFIATGQDDSKFGFNLGNGDALRAVERARRSSSVRLVGLHCHIGSNVFEASSFGKAAEVMAGFANQVDLPELILGGGLGVAYVETEEAPTLTQWGSVLRDACDALGVRARVSVEPGRAIVAGAAITVYTLGTIKTIPGVRTYFSVDGGMSDNPRPVLYGSGYESFLPRAPFAERARRGRLVGKHCESGDVLLFDAKVPADVAVGDLVATPVTGAYGQSMGSNYNRITRPPVIFVRDGDARPVVRRETFDDLLATDLG
ncbi:MAG: diaminopimelate decarboxylase [Ilumatobacter sp.]|uniref:diaminopimelate decarboxylase n=1 Tax=Ilumatobacter sp. TaxID=1967498 RepID=UPI002613BF36|nr:diaminopimelate decarboxylase [Ilumatobacter sp.]MDJ0771070.1 diaminopimelate decarboxylase [Ilumatobacter sp.]